MERLQIPFYRVHAFTDRIRGGNPAVVCPLEEWLPDAVMQELAAENDLSETAFFVPRGTGGGEYHLRWFTPTVEVELCGHATLASGHVVLEHLAPELEVVKFQSQAGPLEVRRRGELLELDFPNRPAAPGESPAGLAEALGARPARVLHGPYLMAVFESADEVAGLAPDFAALAACAPDGVIATAPGEDCDFVSRLFAPAHGVDEDPVTGSAHCTSTPYWAAELGKQELFARQISARGGEIWCTLRGDRVGIAGRAVLYVSGTAEIGSLTAEALA